jgi:YT521-B-like domain
VPWATHSSSPASAPVSRASTASIVPPLVSNSTVEGHQSLSRPEEHRVVGQSPKSNSRPPEGPSFSGVQVTSAPAELDGYHPGVPHSAQTPRSGPPRASIHLKSLSLNADAPYRAMRDTSDRSIRDKAKPAHPSSPGEHEVSEHARDSCLDPVTEEPAKDSDAAEDTSEAWGRPFRVDWIRTTPLSFFRTRHLRNPWNHGREVKVSRDGTELEPNIGRQLLEEWDKPPPSPVNVPTTSSRPLQRHRGPKSTQQMS